MYVPVSVPLPELNAGVVETEGADVEIFPEMELGETDCDTEIEDGASVPEPVTLELAIDDKDTEEDTGVGVISELLEGGEDTEREAELERGAED